MSDRDPQIAAVLDRVLPVANEKGDWLQVMGDVRNHEPQPRPKLAPRRALRLALALAATAIVGTLIAIPALAVAEDWWFFGTHSPAPITEPVVVKDGSWNGHGFQLVAYRVEHGGICFSMTPTSARSSGAGAGWVVEGFWLRSLVNS